jgi:large-conductance mechanosensitive channel
VAGAATLNYGIFINTVLDFLIVPIETRRCRFRTSQIG